MSAMTLVIGDLHGCLSELDELVRQVQVRPGDDVILVGDLLDRGPDPVGVVRRARENGWRAVMGNHEEKALRWLRRDEQSRLNGSVNGIKVPFPGRTDEWRSLSDDDVSWLRNLPLWLEACGWTVVHAGLEPGLSMRAQETDHVTRIRYVDARGEYVKYAEGSLDQPPGTVYWTEAWRQPRSVIYGHAVHSVTDPRVDTFRLDRHPGVFTCAGIDTGCVFGGRLTGMLLQPGGQGYSFVQVQAERACCKLPKKGLAS